MLNSICIETPNEKQKAFFMARQRFIAYGGARGGGKTWAVRRKALLMGVYYPGIRMLLLRRTFPELRENHILPLQKELKGLAVYKETDKSFLFTGGSRLKFGYCDSESDVNQYQGQEYDIIFIDEATHFTEYQYSTLTACLRGANSFPKRMYLTCNPGGVGHAWVKRLFIDRDFQGAEKPEDYCFIAARVYDNQALLNKDPGYVAMLENLPETLRKAWLDGNWDVFEGQYFNMWNRTLHVISPHPIPAYWRRYVTLDYGRDMLAAYWIAVDEHGYSEVYRELYQSGLLASQAAAAIKQHTTETIHAYYAPPDLWNKHSDTGRSTAEIFAVSGIPLLRANNDRVQGWYELAERLQPVADEQGCLRPALRIWRNCSNLIRTLPLLQYDKVNPNDIAREPHELTHAPDALRYFVAGRPRAAKLPVKLENEEHPDYDNQIFDFLRYGGV